jgi:hypothetical protein
MHFFDGFFRSLKKRPPFCLGAPLKSMVGF